MAQALRAGLRNGGIRRGGLRPGLGNGSLFAVAPLDLFFARNRTLDPRVTFTRASSGTYVGSDGVLQTAANDVPRFDHIPTTGESLGLLVEEQRTNLVTSSATFQPSSAGNPASYTIDQVAPDGTTTASRQTAANPRTFVDYQGIANAQYTFSVYAKAASGTVTIALQLKNAASDTVIATGSNVTLTTAWQRLTVTGTTNGATTGARIEVIGPVVGAPAGTVFWGAQLEAGAFPTSYIPTTTATATRSADVASITGTNFSSWYRQDEGTVYTETQLTRQNALIGAAMCGIETGVSNAEAIYMHYRGSGLTAAQIYDNSIGQFDQAPYGAVVPANTLVRQAVAVRLNDSTSAGSGSVQATDTTCTLPTPDRLLVGFSTAANNYLSGTIRRLTYWPARLANSTLETITR